MVIVGFGSTAIENKYARLAVSRRVGWSPMCHLAGFFGTVEFWTSDTEQIRRHRICGPPRKMGEYVLLSHNPRFWSSQAGKR